MGRRKTTGLFKKRGIWQIDKQILGRRLRVSTGTADLKEAEFILAKHIDDIRQQEIFGAKPKRLFDEAMARYLEEKKDKASFIEDRYALERLSSFFIGEPLESIHMGSLKAFISQRQKEGVKNRTINKGLQIIRHLLNLAASEWLNEDGSPWIAHTPKIRLLKETDRRAPYPLTWEEQNLLFKALPDYLKNMALFKVNTGCRDQEVCGLRWEWEHRVVELNTSVFIIPKEVVKNREDRLVVLNHMAHDIVEKMRGTHSTYVFCCGSHRVERMNNTAWKLARKKVGLPQVRVHDLKHTFGRRLRAAGVSFEDRHNLPLN